MDPMQEIRATFFQECEEQLAELESGLLAMQDGEGSDDTVNAVFRAVHSIKGGAGAFALDGLVRFAHVFETTLDELRAGRLAAGPEIVAALLRAADILADLVRAAREGGALDPGYGDAVAAELAALAGADPQAADADDDGMGDFDFQPIAFAPVPAPGPAPEPAPDFDVATGFQPAAAPAGWTIRFRPHAALYQKANDSVLLLRELSRLGEARIELDAAGLPNLPDLDPEGAYLAWTIRLTGSVARDDITEIFEFVESDCDLSIEADEDGDGHGGGGEPAPSGADELDIAALLSRVQAAVEAPEPDPAPARPAPPPAGAIRPEAEKPPAKPAGAPAPTIRVDLDRVDRLIDLVGELVINQAMLAQRVAEASLSRDTKVSVALDELEQLTREIQDSVMAIRAQPVKSVFQRMPRLVREVAGATGKQVRLVTEGEGTEVDKTVIERLSDPLTHMIRNAIDHGLETPEARLAAGKPAEGTVRLSALHRSGRIVIEVADDGAGINRPRVRAIAVEKGLIAPDAALSDEEVDNLIFMPGFSTADAVSDISGRGVGMDVVKRSIQALGGRISISSRPGEGSTFVMSLPLTLAVLDGMVVSAGGETLVVPLSAIVETLQPRPADVHAATGGGRVISIRGAYAPLIDVGAALGYPTTPLQPERSVALLTEGEGGARAVLMVEAIQGQRQVVIKSLEANYRRVPGIAAATILGDGRVALILDVDCLVANSRTAEPSRLLQAG